MQGAVELAVAAAAEAVADRLAARGGQRCDAGEASEAASERTRSRCDQVTISCAATIGPTPGSSSSSGTSARTWPRISRSSSSASAVAASIRRASERRTSTIASSSGVRELERRKRLQRRISCATGRSPQLLTQLLGRGDDHAAELDEREPTDVDGAAPREQQHPQRLLALTRARQRQRLGREARRVRRGSRRADRPCRAAAAPPRALAADLERPSSPRSLRKRVRPAP